jgi:ABC-2 type transport system permease protein
VRNWLRVFFVGGLTSYRALFHWLSPWIYVPILLVYPLFQIVFFAYLGRGASLESDRFFLVGNAIQITAVAGLFGMAQVMGNERWFQTLPALLGSPASRLALFLGRALPTMANAVFVSAFALAAGALVLGIHIRSGAIPTLALAIAACGFSCTGLGVCLGAFGLRGRNVFILANLIDGIFLVLCGVNVPLHQLPGWAQTLSQGLPLTHAISASRAAVAGAGPGDVWRRLAAEALIGAVYLAAGFGLLRVFEYESRRTASLEGF